MLPKEKEVYIRCALRAAALPIPLAPPVMMMVFWANDPSSWSVGFGWSDIDYKNFGIEKGFRILMTRLFGKEPNRNANK
jgi:hypothetical protein